MSSFIRLIMMAAMLFMSYGCKKGEKGEVVHNESGDQDEMLVRINKYLVQKDIELIESYAKRRDWNVTQTETGLFYEIYEKGSGDFARDGKQVTIHYTLSLLDGTVCYSSDQSGPNTFRLGRSREESGLEQGLLMMRVGDRAHLILPPHLAHGLLGDEDKIPARAVIVYDVELVEVE
jgi:FKBP-type peptidyl-prolyl cis-trans isomerase FkpA